MPRRRFGSAGLLDQHMVVEQLHGLRCHQAGGNIRHSAVADRLFKLRYPVPVAVIVEKPPRLAGDKVFGRIGAGVGHVARHTGAQHLNPVGPKPFDQHRAIAVPGLDHCIGYQRRCHHIPPFHPSATRFTGARQRPLEAPAPACHAAPNGNGAQNDRQQL